jgi:DNA-binding response OmpR family regulator
VDLRTRCVERDGHEVQLTAGEFEVPADLMRDPDQVLSRELAVRGFESTRAPRCLDMSEIEAPDRCWLQSRSLSTAAAP